MNSQQTPTDSNTLRAQAEKNMMQGAVTESYIADREEVLKRLNEALATELVCVLRYRSNRFMARGIDSKSVAEEFLTHSNEELTHADKLAARIVQLGGVPDFSPNTLTGRSHAEFKQSSTLIGMIQDNLIAERIAIDSYREFISYLGSKDSTTSQLLKDILSIEEQHADELADFLAE